MSYQVLARKLRPGTFAGLVGQDHVVRALTHALDNDRLHHAYLFTGTRGVGKTTIARVLAKSLNCEAGVSSTPCDQCSICTEVNENRFVDLIEVDAASRTRVDDTRELLENAQYLPARGRFKVYLIDEVHMLSASSFNALLKTLEEPPEHVKFLLATTEAKKVPMTVLSRCLQFQLKNISPERTTAYLADVLAQEGVAFDEQALAVIGKAARGSMRDALSITDQAISFGQGSLDHEAVVEMLGLVGRDEVGSLIAALGSGDAARLLAVVAELADQAVDFEALLADLLAALHEMAVGHALGSDGTGSDGTGSAASDAGIEQLPSFAPEVVQLYYQIGLMGYRDLQIAPDPRGGVEMTLLRMLTFAPDEQGLSVPPTLQAGPAPVSEPGAPPPGPESSAAQSAPVRDSLPVANEVDTAARPQPARQVNADDRWYEIVGGLALAGVAKMIAENSMLMEQSEQTVKLLLDPAHDTLLGDSQVRAVEAALTESLGEDIRLSIEVGEFDAETPAKRRERIAQQRQRDAQSLLESDATVQSLLNEFGGRLDDVRAVEGMNEQTGNPEGVVR